MKVKPFRGIRPPKAIAKEVSSRPYDVLNSEEAAREAEGNPMSLLLTSTMSAYMQKLRKSLRSSAQTAGSCKTRKRNTTSMHRQ